MQSKLPDVNAGLVRHRNAIMISYDQKDFKKAAISFHAAISLLPDEYKLEINTEKYNELVQSKQIICCQHCMEEVKVDKKNVSRPREFERKEIKSYHIYLSLLDSLLSSQKTMLVWRCSSCNELQSIIDSEKKAIKYQRPFYLGVIPEPPMRHGLYDRTNFIQKFQVWYDIVFAELENTIGKYRAEYAAQNPDIDMSEYEKFMDEADIKDAN